MSGLKMRLGFGWTTVFVICAAASLFVLTGGVIKWVAASIGILFTLYAAGQGWKWNGAPWRRVHYRAMLTYAGLAGLETARAEQQGREFSREIACRALSGVLDGNRGSAYVDELLAMKPGGYLSAVLAPHFKVLLPNAPEENVPELFAKLRALDLGPIHVITKAIENRYGETEAARYVVAVIQGKAS